MIKQIYNFTLDIFLTVAFRQVSKIRSQIEDKSLSCQEYLCVLEDQISEKWTTLHLSELHSTQNYHFMSEKHLRKNSTFSAIQGIDSLNTLEGVGVMLERLVQLPDEVLCSTECWETITFHICQVWCL